MTTVAEPTRAQKPTRERKPRKRADGEGTLYFDAKAKLWRASLFVGMKTVKGKDGKLVQRSDRRKVSARKQEDCVARLDALKGERRGGLLPDAAAKDTVAGFIERWLEAKAGGVRERTHQRYGELLRGHVVPTLGKTRLAELRPDSLQRLYAAKLKAGLSPRTVHHVHTVTHNALKDTVRWGAVSRNVADVVDPPSVPTPELRWPTAEEVGRLLDASAQHNDRLHALWVLASHTGMRLGGDCHSKRVAAQGARAVGLWGAAAVFLVQAPPVLRRDHQPCGVAVLPLPAQLPRCGRAARRARDRRELRDDPPVVPEVRANLRRRTAPPACQTGGQMAPR